MSSDPPASETVEAARAALVSAYSGSLPKFHERVASFEAAIRAESDAREDRAYQQGRADMATAVLDYIRTHPQSTTVDMALGGPAVPLEVLQPLLAQLVARS